MGLDVYVGSLTRYYAGDWQTIVQQHAKEMGLQVSVVRPTQADAQDTLKDSAAIRPLVLTWRDQLAQALKAHTDTAITWEEGPETPYFTDKPAWDCYTGLLLWAAYAEHPELVRPKHFEGDWTQDAAFAASSAENFATRCPNLLRGVELWLPCDIPFTFRFMEATGNEVVFGSSVALLHELQDLNARTWQADGATLDRWCKEGAGREISLETKARFAYSLFLRFAALSTEHRLPMRLDY